MPAPFVNGSLAPGEAVDGATGRACRGSSASDFAFRGATETANVKHDAQIAYLVARWQSFLSFVGSRFPHKTNQPLPLL